MKMVFVWVLQELFGGDGDRFVVVMSVDGRCLGGEQSREREVTGRRFARGGPD